MTGVGTGPRGRVRWIVVPILLVTVAVSGCGSSAVTRPATAVAPICAGAMNQAHLDRYGMRPEWALMLSLESCRPADWLTAAKSSRSLYATTRDYVYYSDSAVLMKNQVAEVSLAQDCRTAVDLINKDAGNGRYWNLHKSDLLACDIPKSADSTTTTTRVVVQSTDSTTATTQVPSADGTPTTRFDDALHRPPPPEESTVPPIPEPYWGSLGKVPFGLLSVSTDTPRGAWGQVITVTFRAAMLQPPIGRPVAAAAITITDTSNHQTIRICYQSAMLTSGSASDGTYSASCRLPLANVAPEPVGHIMIDVYLYGNTEAIDSDFARYSSVASFDVT